VNFLFQFCLVGSAGDSKKPDVRMYLKKLNTLNLLQSQNSQTPFAGGTYSEGGLSRTQSSNTLRGGLILLRGIGAVDGSSTALCSRKLNL
jgi:hypothetical protein